MSIISTIKEILRKKATVIVIFLIGVMSIYYAYKYRWNGGDGQGWRQSISSDGYGYYSYLPCVFIYHKFDYERNVTEAQKIRSSAYNVTAKVFGDREIDKCFPGVALLMTPFFLIAYALSYFLGLDCGGYGVLFQLSVCVAGLTYFMIGLVFLSKLNKEYGVSDFANFITLILLAFGTNLLHYFAIEPSMSHVYSFAIVAFFLYYAKKSIDDFKLKNLLLMTIALCVLFLIRPTNILIIIFMPFLAGSLKNTIAFIKRFFIKSECLLLVVTALVILSVEPLLWHWQTGHLFVWSYPGEGFDFKHPHLIKILFSYRKGWFVYTPLMFFAVAGGLIAFIRKNIFPFFIYLLFFVLITYLLSSWHCWYYGGSFGLRAYVDFYAVFALLLAIFINTINKIPVLIFGVLCIILNLIQTYQDNHFIFSSEMTKEKYWKVFLKTSNLYCAIFDYPDTNQYKYIDSLTFKNIFGNYDTSNNKIPSSSIVYNPLHPILLYSENQNSPEFMIKGSKLTSIKNIALYVKLWAFATDINNDAKVIVTVHDKNGNLLLWAWASFQGFFFEKNKWTQPYFIFKLPEIKPDDSIQVFVSNSVDVVCIDDMELKFCTPL